MQTLYFCQQLPSLDIDLIIPLFLVLGDSNYEDLATTCTEISISIIFDISLSISQNRVIDCFHSMSIAGSFTTAIWTGKKFPFKLNIVVSFTILCRNKEIFQIGISDIEKSCDKLSIRNHIVTPFVIRVLWLNTLYAKGYFFYQPDILESTNPNTIF